MSYYADTDEETREQLKQFWDDEFNAISSGETTIERDLKWMRKEVIEAFETYSEANVCIHIYIFYIEINDSIFKLLL